MGIFTLPDDVNFETTGESNDLIFYNYSAPSETFYGKNILAKNAISLVISGEKTMRFAEKKIEISDNEIHFLSTGNCLVSMKLSDKKPFKTILIFFDNKILTDFLLKYQVRINLLTKGQIISKEPFLTFNKDGFIENYITSLGLLFESKIQISSEMKVIKFDELMLYLLENYPTKILAFQSLKNSELNDLEIRKVVENNITTNISIEDMAFLCNISLSTFKRRFLKIYDSSPNKWLLQKRMELAKELLIYNKEKPSEVFYKLGYENHSSFSQSFKQIFGTTPKEFQTMHLDSQQHILNEQP
ncbi:MAG: AraC family transcriptional regulator [Chitinophagaceae bacterium]